MRQDIYRGFTDVHRADVPESLLACLELAAALPSVRGYKRRLRALLHLKPGQTVLDIGCGAGFEACRIAQTYPGVSALELNRETMIRLAARRAEELGFAGRWLVGQMVAGHWRSPILGFCPVDRPGVGVPTPGLRRTRCPTMPSCTN